jgi:PHS family inorganic phosphate transporter-like MFS transporter
VKVKTMALVGAVVGQLGFGAVADLIGRKKVFITTCSMVIIGAIMSSTVQNTSGTYNTQMECCIISLPDVNKQHVYMEGGFGIYSQLTFWRFILGVGIGGEYPLSAAITSESSSEKDMLRNLATVFSMQGIGTVLCSLVLVTLTSTLGTDYNAQWRTALAFGALPMVFSFYFRWKMHETSWEKEAKRTV